MLLQNKISVTILAENGRRVLERTIILSYAETRADKLQV
jgi:hypothetical protein